MNEEFRVVPHEAWPCAERTKRNSRAALERFWKWCVAPGHSEKYTHPGEVTSEVVQRYITYMRRHLSDTTTFMEWAYIRVWFKEHGIVHNKRSIHLPRYNPDKQKSRPLTKDEDEWLFNHCKTKRPGGAAITPAVYLCRLAGLRISEALDLEWSSVDLDGRQLFVKQTKGREDRVVPTTEVLHAYLVQEYRTRIGDWVYTVPSGRRRARNSHDPMLPIYPPTGVRYRWHQLRKTFATRLMEAGIHIAKISMMLGHRNPATTMTYLYPKMDADGVMEQALRVEGSEVA